MNNKTIILGTVNLDWHFAKGSYTCCCADTENTNAFDKAICRILSKSNRSMKKTEIATILGFNVINDPSENRYEDLSEKKIFDNAVEALVNYHLVTDNDNEISLTLTGKQSIRTQTKLRTNYEIVELWVSEFLGSDFNTDLLQASSLHSVDFEAHPDWNILQRSPETTLRIQRKELVDNNLGRSVTSMQCERMEYFIATLKCKICYDLKTQQLYVCTFNNSRYIDDLLASNDILQVSLLDKFFGLCYNCNISTRKERDEFASTRNQTNRGKPQSPPRLLRSGNL